MTTKLIKALPLLISFSSTAVSADLFPESFELVCDRVYVIGQEAKGISSSYVSWSYENKTLTIKSEELSEFNGLLNPAIFKVYSAKKDDDEDTIIELTFKQRSRSDKWIDQKSSKIVAIEIASPNESNNASVKLTDFAVKYGVVQNVTTKHATCNYREIEPLNAAKEINSDGAGGLEPPEQTEGG